MNNKKYLSFSELRKAHYVRQYKSVKKITNIDLNDWKSAPYSFFKSIYYIEGSAILLFILQFTNITPNFVSLVYIALGLLGGIFISTNIQNLVLIGTIIFFSKSIVDWTDGALAKMKKKTSYLGFILDSWGGVVGDISFLVGLGLYLYSQNQNNVFLFLIIIILFFKLIDIKKHAYIMGVDEILKNKKRKIISQKITSKNQYSSFLVNIKIFFSNLFDARSRSVDFICLILLLNTFYKEMIILKYIFYFITLKEIVLFLGSFYVIYFKNFLKKIKII